MSENLTDTWTTFWDMHSGGNLKEPPYEKIYIELPREPAIAEFIDRFGHDPTNVACQCCGQNYSISTDVSLKQATGYHRNCETLKTPRDENGRFKNSDPVIRKNLYLDPDDEIPEGYEKKDRVFPRTSDWIPLEEYIEKDTVKVIREGEIDT